MSYGLTWDGDYWGESAGILVQDVRMPFLTTPRVDVKGLGGADGAVTQGSTFGPRQIQVKLLVKGDDEDQVRSRLTAFALALASTQTGEKSLQFDHHPGKTWTARLVSAVEPDKLYGTVAEVDLEFIAPQPFADSSSESVESRSLTGDTLMAILNNGNVMVDAVYVIKNGGTASAAITIANTTRGETVLWSSSLAGGSWLEVNTQQWSVRSSADAGLNWTDVTRHTTGTMPRLAPGENSITIYGVVSGEVEITFTERYL